MFAPHPEHFGLGTRETSYDRLLRFPSRLDDFERVVYDLSCNWKCRPRAVWSTLLLAREIVAMPIGRVGLQELVYNSTTSGDQFQPAVRALPDGRFFVSWLSDDTNDIRGRLFSIDGSPIGDDFLVNATVGNIESDAAVTALRDGRYVVAWTTFDGADYDIAARLFEADGTPVGNDFPRSRHSRTAACSWLGKAITAPIAKSVAASSRPAAHR